MKAARTALCVAIILAAVRPAAAADIFMGTGPVGTTVHDVGRALCRLIDRTTDITCTPRTTSGPLFNLENVQTGALEFALAPSDQLYEAVQKTGRFRFMDVSFEDLRTLFVLYGQPVTVIARRDAGIEVFEKLEGRRLNIGSPGTPERAMTTLLLSAQGLTKRDLRLAEELPTAQQSLAFCHGRIEAMTYVDTHPSRAVARVLDLCGGVLVDVPGADIERLLADRPDLARIEIAPATYASQARAVATVGPVMTVFASTMLDAETARVIVDAVFDNLKAFKAMHPVLRPLDADGMAKGVLPAPMHDGAAAAFAARGLAR